MLPYFGASLLGRGRGRFTTLNPADKGANLTLSNGNLTVESFGGANQTVRATTSLSNGLRGYRAAITVDGGYLGVANASFASLNSALVGSTLDGVSYRNSDGQVLLNNVNIFTVATAITGDTVDLVINFDTDRFWVRVNSGAWNNNAANNPVTGVGGIDISAMNAGPYFPAVGMPSVSGDFVTVNFMPLDLPGGILAWDQ